MAKEYVNEAQRKLAIFGIKQAAVVKALGVSRPTVSDWFNGHATPKPALRVRLRSALGPIVDIADSDWDRAPELVAAAKGQPKPEDAPAQPLARSGSPLEQTSQILQDVRAQISRLKQATSDPARRDLATLSNALRNYIVQEAALVKQLAEIEDAWAQSASYHALLDRIIDALAEVPGGLDALESALS